MTTVAATYGQQLKLPTFVDSHMALQREPHHARLWGWAAPGTRITAILDDGVAQASGQTNSKGEWKVNLPPQPAGDGHTLAISDGTMSKILDDIVFGDVYFCSGQSNMELSVNAVFNASSEIADSANYPNIRLATVRKAVANLPLTDARSDAANYTWARANPDAFVGTGPHDNRFSCE